MNRQGETERSEGTARLFYFISLVASALAHAAHVLCCNVLLAGRVGSPREKGSTMKSKCICRIHQRQAIYEPT